MSIYRKLLVPSTLAFLLTGYLLTGPANRAAASSVGDSETISGLLSEAKSEAIQLREDGDIYAEPFEPAKLRDNNQ